MSHGQDGDFLDLDQFLIGYNMKEGHQSTTKQKIN